MEKKIIVFDAGPLISLTIVNLEWILPALKKQFGGEFLITRKVYDEVVTKPLSIKRFELEGLQINKYIERGVFSLRDRKEDIDAVYTKGRELYNLASKIFKARHHYITFLQEGEVFSIAAALVFGANAIVVDERSTRMIIETPNDLKKYLEHKLRTSITVNQENLDAFVKQVEKIKIIRSIELAVVAYEMGLLDEYLKSDVPNPREILLDGVLWALKLNGCAIQTRDIEKILKYERKNTTVK